jgi:hypothetical protein
MFNRKSLFSLVVIILLMGLVGFVPGSNSTEVAQAQEGYTLASQQGTYAYTCTSTANVAAGFGVFTSDGNGNMTSAGDMFNVPAPDGSRQVIPYPPGAAVATYTMNADGTSTATWTMTNPDGTTTTAHMDRVITQAEVVGGVKLATEFFAMQREPFGPGALVTYVAKRLPDEGVFTNASAKGTWAYTITGGPNIAGAQGICTIDENGKVTGPFIVNAPAPDGSRLVVPGTIEGTYTQHANGTGTSSYMSAWPDGSTGGGTLDFVITQARAEGQVKVATEMFAMQREPWNGLFLTYTFKRLPDEGVFTNASVQGTWAYTIMGGPNVGCVLGVETFDENRNGTGPFILNAPTPDGARLVIPGTVASTHTLNANGTGTGSYTATFLDGSTTSGTLDMLITQANVVGGVKVATEMVAMQREPWNGLFLTYTFKRLPDEGEFTTASLRGAYAGILTGGPTVAAGAEIDFWDGNGNVTASGIANVPTPDGGRMVMPYAVVGTYTVNANGTATCPYTATFPDGSTGGGTLDMVITQAEVISGVKVATEFFAISREGNEGMLVTFVFKRLPD